MLSVIHTFPVAKGKEVEFEAAFELLQAQVLQTEPGTVGFQLYRAQQSKRDYKIIAHFRDEQSRVAHDIGSCQDAVNALYALCDGTPKFEVWLAV